MTKQTNALFIILVSCLFAYFLRFDNFHLPQNYLVSLLLTLVLASIILPATGAFRHEFRWAIGRKVRRLIAGWSLVIVSLIAAAALFKVTANFSRVWFAYWVALCTIGLTASQLIGHSWQIHKKGHSSVRRRVVLVGGGQHGNFVRQRILKDPDGELELIGCFGGDEDWSGEAVLPVTKLAKFVSDENIAEVWVAMPAHDGSLLEKALGEIKELVVEVNVIPDFQRFHLLNQNIFEWNGIPVINLSGTPMTHSERRLKALFDRISSFILLLVLLPLMLILMLLVRLSSPGPIFFRQARAGMGGEAIDILKFRSMKTNNGEFAQATNSDSRVTPIGRFLRRTSLDELPQLFNVLKGEMSLVGPRPHPIELNEQFVARIPRYMLRHKVKPGITGWAQVNGYRGITDTDDKMALRIEHDLWYIQNWSLWLDLKILLQTPLAMIHRNAF